MSQPMLIGQVIKDSRRTLPDYRRLELDTGHHITRPHNDCDWLPDMRNHWFRVKPAQYFPDVARYDRLTFPMIGKQWKGKILECDLAGKELRIIVGVPDSSVSFLAYAPKAETLGEFAMRHNILVQADIATCMIGDEVKFKPNDKDAFLATITKFYKKKRRVRKPTLYLVKTLSFDGASPPPVAIQPTQPTPPPPRAA